MFVRSFVDGRRSLADRKVNSVTLCVFLFLFAFLENVEVVMRLRSAVVRLALDVSRGPANPERPNDTQHSIGFSVWVRGTGRWRVLSVVFFIVFCLSWVMVPSELRAGRRVARSCGAPSTWAMSVWGGRLLLVLAKRRPHTPVWGVVFWALGCELPGEFSGHAEERRSAGFWLRVFGSWCSGFSFSFGRSSQVMCVVGARPRVRLRLAATRFNLHGQEVPPDGRVRVNGPPNRSLLHCGSEWWVRSESNPTPGRRCAP